MAIPTTSFSALVLVVLSAFLLGIWSSTFKLAGSKWRFELFSLDFAIGALLFSIAASYFFGTLGSDTGFEDHMLISSRTNQAYAIGAGFLFAFGNVMLLASISLIGLSLAYPIASGAALLVFAGLTFNADRALLLGGVAITAIIAMICSSMAADRGNETLPAASLPMPAKRNPQGRQYKATVGSAGMATSTKGTLTAILAGLSLAGSMPALNTTVYGIFSLGPYAAVVLFCLGLLGATIVLSFFFMNLPVHGGSIPFAAYFRGSIVKHFLGWIGGALCIAALTMILVNMGFPADAQPDKILTAVAPPAAAILAILVGLAIWREHSGARGSVTRSLLLGSFFLVVAIALFGLAQNKELPPVQPAPAALLKSQLPA